MRDYEYFLVVLVWASLFLAPPVALILFVWIRRLWPQFLRLVAVSCVFTLIAVKGATALGISFTGSLANVMCVILAYLAFCLLAVSSWQIRRWIFRFPVMIVMAFPIALGYAFATIGALGLMFVVGDYVRAPHEKQAMREGIECRITTWGMAASDSGYTVHLYKRWKLFPIMERELTTIVVNQTNPVNGIGEATCEDALKQYTGPARR